MGKEPGRANESGMGEKLEKEEVRKSRLEVPGNPEEWSRERPRECESREAGETVKATVPLTGKAKNHFVAVGVETSPQGRGG